MEVTPLSTLADHGLNHAPLEMTFGTVDVARVARAVEAKPTWLSKRLLGFNPAGIARLLRKLWLVNDSLLATVEAAHKQQRQQEDRLRWFQYETRTMVWKLDRLMETHGKKPGVLVMSEREFNRLDEEYDCPDRHRTASGDRWAFTYRGLPVFTARAITGPFIMTPPIFEGFKLALGATLSLRER